MSEKRRVERLEWWMGRFGWLGICLFVSFAAFVFAQMYADGGSNAMAVAYSVCGICTLICCFFMITLDLGRLRDMGWPWWFVLSPCLFGAIAQVVPAAAQIGAVIYHGVLGFWPKQVVTSERVDKPCFCSRRHNSGVIGEFLVVGGSCLAAVSGHVAGLVASCVILYGFTHSYSARFCDRSWIDWVICFFICAFAYSVSKWIVEHVLVFLSVALAMLFGNRD